MEICGSMDGFFAAMELFTRGNLIITIYFHEICHGNILHDWELRIVWEYHMYIILYMYI